ncbi:response regulator [Brevundimonas diminuta]|jgi:CheY-like chemotaxis protein|uniref:response regulator n=1 Tax=Brevundimonas diminuta TaxID=293 RepID=UPI0022AF36CC|nr:response regulator [Brevundimonas diminuta]MCZ4107769.1 response regulator [Brevundimonas diminuta]
MRGMNGVGESLRESAVFNFDGAMTMVIDDSPFSLELTAQALLGFGMKVRHACESAAEAISILQTHPVDLILVDCEMPGMSGYEFVRWLRRSGLEPNAYTPVIMTAAHVRRSKVSDARDCGANFLITKPFSAGVLLERIVWVSRDNRPFLEVGDYFGPDRRFRSEPWPGPERRAEERRKTAFEKERRAAVEL